MAPLDDVVDLGPWEFDGGHANTDPALYSPDLDLLAYMLQDLRSLLRSNAVGRVELIAHGPVIWEVHGLRRRTVVCEPALIRRRDDVCIVGFFGDRRIDLTHGLIDDVDVRLLDEFRAYPGILSYSSIELADDYWANLVVHAEPDDRSNWRTSTAHVHAVSISPQLYSAVRIHNGFIAGGVTGNRAVSIESTKYWDYDTDPVWRAIRRFDPPLERVRRQTN
jgi:hypothetical protein